MANERLNSYSETSFSDAPAGETDKTTKSKKKTGDSERVAEQQAAEVSAEPAPKAPKAVDRLLELMVKPNKEEKAPEKAAEDKADKHAEAAEPDDTPEADMEVSAEELEKAKEFTPDELQEVTRQLLKADAESLQAELETAAPGSQEAATAQAQGEYVAGINELIDEGEDPLVAIDSQFKNMTGMDPEAMPPASEAPAEDDEDTIDSSAQAGGSRGVGRGGPPVMGGPGFGFAGGQPANYNNVPATPNAPEDDIASRRRESRAAISGLLVGGIVGYLLGRRRGRIRTERQLLPIQKALETRVRQLDETLKFRQDQIRRFVIERDEREKQTMQKAQEVKPAPVAHEQAGPFKAEAPKQVPNAEKLHINDVLKISETITVGSTTIRRVYETNLISERGLRRVVSEHLRGGDVRRVLTEELLIKEIGHELDPMLRDRSPEDVAASTTISSSAADDSAISDNVPSSSSGVTTAPVSSRANSAQSKEIPQKLIVANITALVVLAGVLIVLLVVWLMR